MRDGIPIPKTKAIDTIMLSQTGFRRVMRSQYLFDYAYG
jgi:hypothetical protein